MLTPECFNILQRAFERAKYSDLRDNIHPPPSCIKTRRPHHTQRYCYLQTYKPKEKKLVFTDASPHIITALQNWALVTKEKMSSPFDHDPTLPQYWSEHPRDR